MAKAVSPPSSIEAEKILIGCILLDPNKFVEAAGYIIEDEVFYDNRNQLLWRKIKNMISLMPIKFPKKNLPNLVVYKVEKKKKK